MESNQPGRGYTTDNRQLRRQFLVLGLASVVRTGTLVAKMRMNEMQASARSLVLPGLSAWHALPPTKVYYQNSGRLALRSEGTRPTKATSSMTIASDGVDFSFQGCHVSCYIPGQLRKWVRSMIDGVLACGVIAGLTSWHSYAEKDLCWKGFCSQPLVV